MNKIIVRFAVAFIIGTVALGCGIHEGMVQREDLGFVEFTGNWQNADIRIDNLNPLILKSTSDPEKNVQDSPALIYKLPKGKHNIKVYRDGNLVVDRVVFIDSNMRLEVNIP